MKLKSSFLRALFEWYLVIGSSGLNFMLSFIDSFSFR
jgi:hypothetical protein